jgi:hypothetical protein
MLDHKVTVIPPGVRAHRFDGVALVPLTEPTAPRPRKRDGELAEIRLLNRELENEIAELRRVIEHHRRRDAELLAYVKLLPPNYLGKKCPGWLAAIETLLEASDVSGANA